MYEWTFEISALLAGVAIGVIAKVIWDKRGKQAFAELQADLERQRDSAKIEAAKLRVAADAYRAKYDDLKQQIVEKVKAGLEK